MLLYRRAARSRTHESHVGRAQRQQRICKSVIPAIFVGASIR